MRQAVILCGGKGSRLGEAFAHLPKPLVPVGGVPLLDRLIATAAAAGIQEVILAAGHLGDMIERHCAASNSWGVSLRLEREKTPLGTAGCLRPLEAFLDEDFLLLYGDVFLDLDLNELIAGHERRRPVATLLVRQSDHPDDSDLVELADDGITVTAMLPKARRDPGGTYRNCANAAVQCCSRNLLRHIPTDRPSDLATDVFPAVLAAGGRLDACWLDDRGYVKDMGTPARLETVEKYWARRERAAEGRRHRLRLRAVILDRDGVLIEDAGPRHPGEPLALLPGVGEALRQLHERGLVCLVATNQPWIARGLLTVEEVVAVHARLTELAAESGGRLTEIIFSPFHPETHHGEGIPEFRRASECRKPRPGMLFELMERHGLAPAETAMVGDSYADMVAGWNAGVRTLLVGVNPRATLAGPDTIAPSLQEAVPILLAWN